MIIIEVRTFRTDYFAAVRRLTGQLTPHCEPMTESYFRQLVAAPHAHLFLITDGQFIAGMLTVGTYPTPTGMKAWIEDVVVDSSFRGQGLGRELVAHAQKFVRERGWPMVMLTSNPARVEANKLYPAMGFEPKITNVYVYKPEQ